jgi:hypothetical protein
LPSLRFGLEEFGSSGPAGLSFSNFLSTVKKWGPHSRKPNLSTGYKFKGAACILPYKFIELKESPFFVELIKERM